MKSTLFDLLSSRVIIQSISLAAKYHGVLFYIAAPSSSIDMMLENGQQISIEERPPHELTTFGNTRIAAHGIGCWNPGFDITPAELITGGIITELGVYQPSQLKEALSDRLKPLTL